MSLSSHPSTVSILLSTKRGVTYSNQGHGFASMFSHMSKDWRVGQGGIFAQPKTILMRKPRASQGYRGGGGRGGE